MQERERERQRLRKAEASRVSTAVSKAGGGRSEASVSESAAVSPGRRCNAARRRSAVQRRARHSRLARACALLSCGALGCASTAQMNDESVHERQHEVVSAPPRLRLASPEVVHFPLIACLSSGLDLGLVLVARRFCMELVDDLLVVQIGTGLRSAMLVIRAAAVESSLGCERVR